MAVWDPYPEFRAKKCLIYRVVYHNSFGTTKTTKCKKCLWILDLVDHILYGLSNFETTNLLDFRHEISTTNLLDFRLDQKKTRSIAASFQKCGLDPWASDLQPFKNHLDGLSESKVCEVLLKNRMATSL